MIKWFFDEQNVPYFQFFKVGTDEKPFFRQLYGEGSCDHRKIAAYDNHCGSGLGDYEPTKELLQ